MSPTKAPPKIQYLSPQTAVLIEELEEECQGVLKLLARLEMAGLQDEQVESILGQLSAAVLHLHEHTRDLDVLIDEDPGGTQGCP